MISITDAINSIFEVQPELRFGLNRKLFNLTQLAEFLKPLIEAKCKKEITSQALIMSLSRYNKNKFKKHTLNENFVLEHIRVHANLCVVTFEKDQKSHILVNQLYSLMQDKRGYLTITEGITEITIILEARYLDLISKKSTFKPKRIDSKASAIAVTFPEKYVKVSGFIFRILEPLALQNINLIEISSTTTEIIMYLNENDVRLAFDTLLTSFSNRILKI